LEKRKQSKLWQKYEQQVNQEDIILSLFDFYCGWIDVLLELFFFEFNIAFLWLEQC